MYQFECEMRESGRAGWQERLRAPIDAISVEEGAVRHGGRETHLNQLLKYWHDIGQGRTPCVSTFDAQLPADLAGKISFVDCSYEDPRHFVLLRHLANPIEGLGTELSGLRLMHFPIDQHARCCAAEYVECRATNLPHYSLIDQELGGLRRRYTRCMVPLAGPDGSVRRIAYAYRSLQAPRFFFP
jgi:hypothetical protein